MFLGTVTLLAWSFSALGGGSVSTTNGFAVAVNLLEGAEWSGVSFALPDRADEQRLVAFSLLNTGTNALTVTLKSRLSHLGSERQERKLVPGQDARFVFNLRPKTLPLDFVLDGLYGYGKAAGRDRLARSVIDIFGRSREGGSFSVTNIVLACGESCRLPEYDETAFFPFCDGYGQFVHKDWPSKVHSDEELKAAGRTEAGWLTGHAVSPISSADRFGGWADGPQLAATGRFRVRAREFPVQQHRFLR